MSLTTNVWGWALYGNFYFDNSTKQWSNVSLCIGTSSGSNAYVFSHIDNTNLWYRQLDYSSFGNAIFLNGNWTDENWWNGWDYRPEGRTWSLSSDDKWEIYNTNYNTKNSDNSMKSYRFNGSDNSSASGELEFHTAYLRVKYDERDGNGYGSIIEGETTWSHGVTFDFTGTYLTSASASKQTKISSLTKNCWTDGSQKWGYENIPHTGEVRFELTGISTGFELEGWAYASDATSPSYTTNPEDVTFNVTGNTMYVAMVRRKQYTVTLNRNGGSSGTASVITTYDKTYNLTSSIIKPSKDGYTFKGYWTNNNGTGTQLIDKDGAWIKDVTGYTGSDNGNPKWVRDGGVTLYAKWEQTITLDKNGSDGSNTTATAVYNAAGPFAPAATQTYTDHTLLYYKTSGGTPILTTSGAFYSSSISSYVTDGKWTKANATTLYAHWKVNAPGSITCTDNVVTISVPTDATVHYTTNGTDPTASSPTYDPSNKPVIASSGITVKAIAVQSGCDNSTVASQAVTYTPVYTVDFTTTNASKSTGELTVLENHEYVATFSDVTGYDLPDDVEVIISGNTATKTTDYTWSAGTLTILANKIDGDVTISVTGDPEEYDEGEIEGGEGSDGTYSVTYNDTKIVIGTAPARPGYEVAGYYLTYNEEEEDEADKYTNKVANKNEVLESSLPGYIVEGKWRNVGAPMLYVRWNAKQYKNFLNPELDGKTGTEGSDYFTVTMNSANYKFGDGKAEAMTRPTANGYTFNGYYTAASSGTQIFDRNGNVISEVSTYTGTNSKWIHTTDGITLHAQWSANTYTVTLNNEGADSGKEGTDEVTATFDATTNLTSAITKPQKSGYTFGGYYTGQGGTGSQLIDASGNWIASVSGYTGEDSDDPVWKYYSTSTLNLYAKWTQTISFDQNGATVNGTTSLAATYNGTLSPGGITNPNKIGYAFAGWATAADGDVVIEPNGTVNDVDDWTEDGKWIHAGESELVATWTADVNNFKVEATTTAWGTADNWSQNKVPTEYTEVHIKGNATVSSHVYVGKVVIEEGTLTIASTGALEVASTITNTDEDKLIVNSRGALIFDNSAGSTYATVELSTTYASAGSHFQFIGLPVWGVSVSTAFAGKGVYTYAWKQGEGWERRGYYDDLMAFEAIALMGSSGYTFHGALVPTTDKEYSLSYADRENGDVYMYGNSWTAPIKVSGMTIDSYDGAHIYDGSTGSWDGAVSGDVIPAMQAFAVLAKSGTGGSVSIPYNTAVRNATSPNAPLRAPQRNTPDILDHISVYVTGNELQTRMRLFENEQFTNDIDNGYEAIHMEGEGRAGELYAQADDKMTVLATPNLEGTVVGFIPGEATNYTISFEGDGKGYYLNDVVTNQSTLIAEGNTYMFTPDESTNDTRFIISKTPIHNMPTGVDAVNDGVKARKQMINGILYIIRDGRLYDATGALVK